MRAYHDMSLIIMSLILPNAAYKSHFCLLSVQLAYGLSSNSGTLLGSD